MKLKFHIVCETDGCPNKGKKINVVTAHVADDEVEEQIDLFFESFDGSDEADFCPKCKKLGILQDRVYRTKDKK